MRGRAAHARVPRQLTGNAWRRQGGVDAPGWRRRPRKWAPRSCSCWRALLHVHARGQTKRWVRALRSDRHVHGGEASPEVGPTRWPRRRPAPRAGCQLSASSIGGRLCSHWAGTAPEHPRSNVGAARRFIGYKCRGGTARSAPKQRLAKSAERPKRQRVTLSPAGGCVTRCGVIAKNYTQRPTSWCWCQHHRPRTQSLPQGRRACRDNADARGLKVYTLVGTKPARAGAWPARPQAQVSVYSACLRWTKPSRCCFYKKLFADFCLRSSLSIGQQSQALARSYRQAPGVAS